MMNDPYRCVADGLCLAAAPTFAIMALLTGVLGGGPLDVLCSGSPLTGMVPMYLLMSAFHSAPWLRLISRRQGAIRLRGLHAAGRVATKLRQSGRLGRPEVGVIRRHTPAQK